MTLIGQELNLSSLLAHLAAEDRDTFMQLLLDMVKAENEQANRGLRAAVEALAPPSCRAASKGNG